MEILGASKIQYEIRADYEPSNAVVDTPFVLPPTWMLKSSDRGISLVELQGSPESVKLFADAEMAFRSEDYENAIADCRKCIALQPDYFPALRLIGDTYYHMGMLDSAIAAFKQAIDLNFADYDSHWFLADTYTKAGQKDSALREITTAFLLNVNHKHLNAVVRAYRKNYGRPWKEWDFRPLYTLTGEGNHVTVCAATNWLGYALVKAAWKYEPGYAESVTGGKSGDRNKNVINWPEEKEALVALMTDPEFKERFQPIIEEGYFQEFVLFEIAAKKAPAMMPLLPRESFNRIIEYVEKFH